MECFTPGSLLILPSPELLKMGPEAVSRLLEAPFEIRHSIGDILSDRGFEIPEEERWHDPLPLLARVQEGREFELSDRLLAAGLARAACPDYAVWPNAPIRLDAQAIARALGLVNAQPPNLGAGTGCTVAILDSGIDGNLLPHPASVHAQQFDVRDPYNRGYALEDRNGHGTLVANIVNAMAPAARILSVRVVDRGGSFSDVLAGLHLSSALGGCDIVNLSLSINCDPVYCPNCTAPARPVTSAEQIRLFFDRFFRDSPDTIVLAAAGNASPEVKLPAALDGIIAVGEFDYRRQRPSLNSDLYRSVPADRYVLAPSRDGGNAPLATVTGFGGPEPLYGTSFATAFATGVVARHIADLKASGAHASATAAGLFENVRQALAAAAKPDSYRGYQAGTWGLGPLSGV